MPESLSGRTLPPNQDRLSLSLFYSLQVLVHEVGWSWNHSPHKKGLIANYNVYKRPLRLANPVLVNPTRDTPHGTNGPHTCWMTDSSSTFLKKENPVYQTDRQLLAKIERVRVHVNKIVLDQYSPRLVRLICVPHFFINKEMK